jgi:hypothetical protein
MPPLPAPPRPAAGPPPPARPSASLPDSEDGLNQHLFADEFDVLPLPDPVEAKKAALVCDHTNLEYIPSCVRTMLSYEYGDFFARMARHQWRGVQANASGPRAGMFLGARRPIPPAGGGSSEYIKFVDDVGRGMATDWDKIPGLKRVNAYAFRGDRRSVRAVKAANGFHPPSSRTDAYYVQLIAQRFAGYLKERYNKDVSPDEVVAYIGKDKQNGLKWVEYEMWRSILEREKFHIGRMVANEFLRGYISTSRDVMQSRGFLAMGSSPPRSALYVVHTEGGFLLPPRAQHVHGFGGNEAEIAHPGPIPWRKVLAFRTYMGFGLGAPSKILFVRKGAVRADRWGMEKALAALGSVR